VGEDGDEFWSEGEVGAGYVGERDVEVICFRIGGVGSEVCEENC
jgi:hypothetical protein